MSRTQTAGLIACGRMFVRTIFNHMVNYQSSQLDATFSALSDPTRRAIISRLAQGPASVGELAGPFNMSLPAVSKHIKILTRAGLLHQDKQGRIKHCSLIAGSLANAGEWIQFYKKFWEFQLNALDEFLSGEK